MKNYKRENQNSNKKIDYTVATISASVFVKENELNINLETSGWIANIRLHPKKAPLIYAQ